MEQLKNFLATTRKGNLRNFAVFPVDEDLSWIPSLATTRPEPDTINGTKDGVNTTFTLDSGDPGPDVEVLVLWDGAIYRDGLGFTRTGATIELFGAPDASAQLKALKFSGVLPNE